MKNLEAGSSSGENERQPRSSALLFTGQGVSAGDISSYYTILNELDPDLMAQHMSAAQQAIDEILPPEYQFNILEEINSPDSDVFGKTSSVQPVVYTLSVAAFEILKKKLGDGWITPSFVAGHSLGEYSALTAAGVLEFNDGIKIVTSRGLFMQRDSEKKPTKLAAVIGKTEDEVGELCLETETAVSLFNAPGNIAVGGDEENMAKLTTIAGERGIRIIPIRTAGAFHTDAMSDAANELEGEMQKYTFKDLQTVFVSNLTGEPEADPEDIRRNLVSGMTKPVEWVKVIQTMKDAGVEFFYEVGPGNTLTGLNSRNAPNAQTTNITNLLPQAA